MEVGEVHQDFTFYHGCGSEFLPVLNQIIIFLLSRHLFFLFVRYGIIKENSIN